jgi:hypothetical protein
MQSIGSGELEGRGMVVFVEEMEVEGRKKVSRRLRRDWEQNRIEHSESNSEDWYRRSGYRSVPTLPFLGQRPMPDTLCPVDFLGAGAEHRPDPTRCHTHRTMAVIHDILCSVLGICRIA